MKDNDQQHNAFATQEDVPFPYWCVDTEHAPAAGASFQLVEPGLTNSSSAHQEGNWNGEHLHFSYEVK
jgi:hypothetical protein